MLTPEDIMQDLSNIIVPGVLRSLVKMNLVCDEGNIERYDAEIVASLGKSLAQATSAKVSSEKK